MSETNTPASTATGNDALTLADEIKKYKMTELISFLQGQDLELEEEDLKNIRKRYETRKVR